MVTDWQSLQYKLEWKDTIDRIGKWHLDASDEPDYWGWDQKMVLHGAVEVQDVEDAKGYADMWLRGHGLTVKSWRMEYRSVVYPVIADPDAETAALTERVIAHARAAHPDGPDAFDRWVGEQISIHGRNHPLNAAVYAAANGGAQLPHREGVGEVLAHQYDQDELRAELLWNRVERGLKLYWLPLWQQYGQ